ncbi:hypothetical protein MKX01_017145 [Papaver californicum]|nr:hypothetical protein MKX01_017145 [Papaver californicum]
MAVTSRGRTTEVQIITNNKWKDNRENTTSPERRKVWTEIKPTHYERKVSVVYYLCRSGSLEHPHFMEVPLSSNDGLFLRDVINRLNLLRGKGMATMYSWSSKRSYKNGFVWQDLSESDFIYPVHGQEYVLKGSELLDIPPLNNFESATITTSSSTSSSMEKRIAEVEEEEAECDFPVIVRRRNQSWSSIDLNEYKVYKPESNIQSPGKGADASTQTDDKRRRIRRSISSVDDIHPKKISPNRIIEEDEFEEEQNQTTELTREEISPPPSSSSPETLETLIKSHRCISQCTNPADQLSSPNDQNKNSGRIKASAVLMQLISCGTISCTTSSTSTIAPSDKSPHQDGGGGGGGGFSLISYYKSRLPRGTGSSSGNQMSSSSSANVVDCLMENPSFEKITLEDKEYFSGSLIETNKKEEFSVMQRSSSYNADRSSKLVLRDKEIDGVRAKCIPRKPKLSMHIRKQSNSNSSNISMKSSTSNNIISPSSSSNDLHLGTGGGRGSNSKRHSSGSSSSVQ